MNNNFLKNLKLHANQEWKEVKVNGKMIEIPVDWKVEKLKNLLDYEHSNKYIVDDINYSNDYKTPVLTAGKSLLLGYTNETNNIFKNLPVIIFDDFTTSQQYINFEFKVKSGAMKILKQKSNVDLKLINILMKRIQWDTSNHKRYWISEYQNLKIILSSTIQEQENIASFLTNQDEIIEHFNDLEKCIEDVMIYFQQELLSGRLRIKLKQKYISECEELGLIETNNELQDYDIVSNKKDDFEKWLSFEYEKKVEFYENDDDSWKKVKVNGKMVKILVDWKVEKLKNLLDYEHSNKYIVDDVNYSNDYKTPVLTAGKSLLLGYTNEINNIFKNLPVIIFDDFTTSQQYINFEFKVKSGAMKILKQKSNVDLKLINILMKRIQWDTSNHKRYWISEYQNLKIILPSTILEQTLIASYLTHIDEYKEKIQEQLEREKKMFLFFSQELLSGRLRFEENN